MPSPDLISAIRHLAGIAKLHEGEDLEQEIRDKLREIVTAAQHRYKTKAPEDLADELDDLLKRANLQKPPALTKKQYDAVAGVWEALGDDLSEVQAAAGRALMLMSESADPKQRSVILAEKAGADVTATLASMQRWLRGVSPTANAYARKIQGAVASGAEKAAQTEMQVLADALQQIVTALSKIDEVSRRLLGRRKS